VVDIDKTELIFFRKFTIVSLFSENVWFHSYITQGRQNNVKFSYLDIINIACVFIVKCNEVFLNSLKTFKITSSSMLLVKSWFEIEFFDYDEMIHFETII
jgi:hypothetical protein